MSDLYVLQPDGTRFGPLTKDAIARGIVDGTIAQDSYLAPPGAPQWFHASQLPAVTALVESLRKTSSVPPPRKSSSPPRPTALRATLESPMPIPVKDAPQTDPQLMSAAQTQPHPAVMRELAAMTVVSPSPPATIVSERSPLADKPVVKPVEPKPAEIKPAEAKAAEVKPTGEPSPAKQAWPKWLPF